MSGKQKVLFLGIACVCLAVMLALTLGPTLTPQTPVAKNDVQLKEEIANGTESEITLTEDVIIGDPGEDKNGLDITRSVTLDLNGKTLEITTTGKNTNGIKIAPGKTLTIKDSVGGGKLIVKNTNRRPDPESGYGAGIDNTDAALIIESGEVTAESGRHGAGIGGSGGKIGISGGTVIAKGSDYGWGIYGNVDISGGVVTATGSDLRDGIYGRYINISGGIVTATGGLGASGIHIDCGYEGEGGTVNISGGTVTAIGGRGAGSGIIGGPENGGGTIDISGGIVRANVGRVAINKDLVSLAGGNGNGVGIVGKLTITGGNVVSKSRIISNRALDAIRVATDGTNPVIGVDVTVTDGANKAVEGAELSVGAYRALTDASGKATIWIPEPSGKEITVTKSDQQIATTNISASAPFKASVRMQAN